MVDGEHKFVMEYAADKIARALGKTLVAPVITYVPEGSWENPRRSHGQARHHHAAGGSVRRAARHAGRSLKSGGFTTILFLGESGGNRTGMRTAADEAERAVEGRARARSGSTTTTRRPRRSERVRRPKTMGIPAERDRQPRQHPRHVRDDVRQRRSTSRANKLARRRLREQRRQRRSQSKSTPALGKAFLQIKIDNAIAQIKALMAGAAPRPPVPSRAGGARRAVAAAAAARRRRRARRRRARRPAARADDGDGAGGQTPTQAPDTVFIDELTWEETRDADEGGEDDRDHPDRRHREERVPHGARQAQLRRHPRGEPDGAPAEERARGADDSVRARGQSRSQNPGAISLPSPAYDQLLDAAARSLKAHGFKEIIFIGDSGGNQAGMTSVANEAERGVEGQRRRRCSRSPTTTSRAASTIARGWKPRSATTTRSSAPRRHQRHVADAARPSGRHAQGSDQAVGRPGGLRRLGDPMKATAEIGRMGIEFKINAAIAQYRLLKNPPPSAAAARRRAATARPAPGGPRARPPCVAWRAWRGWRRCRR